MSNFTPQLGTSTPAQRQGIVLAGRSRGLSVDDLRALTPSGSIRALSFDEASLLLDRLNEGREPQPQPCRRRRPRRSRPGILKLITPRQREEIDLRRRQLGWTDEGLEKFLQRTFTLTAATLSSRRDASRVITVLRKIVAHAASKAGSGNVGSPGETTTGCARAAR